MTDAAVSALTGMPSRGLPDLDYPRKVSLTMLVYQAGTAICCVEEPYL